jgi:uncharacterized protein (DUF362 family)
VKENLFTDGKLALVSKVACCGDLRQDISQAVNAVGGFEQLVEAGDTILLKPNFNTADTPPGSSDPPFVTAVIELLYEHGAAKVILADFTLGLKLTMGFVRPQDRIKMHLWHLREKLADLNLIIAPDLIIMDGRRCFIGGGPQTGELREPNLILASGDRIAMDVEGVRVIQGYPGHSLGQDAWSYPIIRRAVELGLGSGSEAAYRVVDAASGGQVDVR